VKPEADFSDPDCQGIKLQIVSGSLWGWELDLSKEEMVSMDGVFVTKPFIFTRTVSEGEDATAMSYQNGGQNEGEEKAIEPVGSNATVTFRVHCVSHYD